MVLVTHHTQSSYVTLPFETLSSSKGIKLKHNGIQLQVVSQTNGFISLKHTFPLRPVPRCACKFKGKSLRISSFKGHIQPTAGGDSANKSKPSKNAVKTSTVPLGRDETTSESPAPHDVSVSYASESDKTISGSKAIRRLFKKWLNILHTGEPSDTGSNMLEGVPEPQVDCLQEQKSASTKESGGILKVILCYFLGLDATITIPLIIFIPLYLAINVVYGPEVSRELTPLWVLGPLVVALYIKLVRGIITLYVFSFKQTVKVITNLPAYYEYITGGKLKEVIRARLLQPIHNFKNADFKDLALQKWSVLREWLTEKYLDYVESIWPFYCRTIRFLKSANLL